VAGNAIIVSLRSDILFLERGNNARVLRDKIAGFDQLAAP